MNLKLDGEYPPAFLHLDPAAFRIMRFVLTGKLETNSHG